MLNPLGLGVCHRIASQITEIPVHLEDTVQNTKFSWTQILFESIMFKVTVVLEQACEVRTSCLAL